MNSVRTNYQSNPFVKEYSWGICVSFALHVLIALIALIVLESRRSQGMQLGHQVFTVTLEGGERLGGVFQEPLEPKGPPINPFKQSAAKEEQEEKKSPPKEPEKQPVKEPEQQAKEPEVKADVEKEKELEKLQADAMLEEQRRQEDELRKMQEKKKLEEEKLKKEEQDKLKKQQDEEKKKKLEEDRKKKEEEDKKKKVEDEKLAHENEEKARKDREARIKRAIGKVQQQGERPVKDVYQGESYDVGGQGFGAASLGGKGMGGGTLASLEFVSYMNRLEGHIKSGWRWIRGDEQFQAQLLVRIAEDGTIQSVELIESSGNRQFDDSAVRAVYKSSPVPPPPENLYDKVREIRMVFDSHDS